MFPLSTTPAATEKVLRDACGPVLLIGPAYSGKSELARKALQHAPVTAVIGTAPMTEDKLMKERLAELRKMVSAECRHIEYVDSLAQALADAAGQGCGQILVDSVSHWIAGMVLSLGTKYDLDQIRDILLQELSALATQIGALSQRPDMRLMLVSSEMGACVVPREAASRLVRFVTGRFNLKLAQCCSSVYYVICGIPLPLK